MRKKRLPVKRAGGRRLAKSLPPPPPPSPPTGPPTALHPASRTQGQGRGACNRVFRMVTKRLPVKRSNTGGGGGGGKEGGGRKPRQAKSLPPPSAASLRPVRPARRGQGQGPGTCKRVIPMINKRLPVQRSPDGERGGRGKEGGGRKPRQAKSLPPPSAAALRPSSPRAERKVKGREHARGYFEW
jgi:hypothetical protein